MTLLSNLEFYKKDEYEIHKYISRNEKSLIITGYDSGLRQIEEKNIDFVKLSNENNIFLELDYINQVYDSIILVDTIEVINQIDSFLIFLKKYLKKDGKIILSSINPFWNRILSFTEVVKLKNKSKNRAYIHLRKIQPTLHSLGLEVVKSYSRQFFPFKLFFIGHLLNNVFELIFYYFNLGIKTYIIVRNIPENVIKKDLSKSIIIPAKNEEGNLIELIERIPYLGKNVEVIISCGESQDRTVEVARAIKSENLNIKVIQQSRNGKANAVWEALEVSSGEVISILDADLSVDPEKLIDFFNIIENNRADFVNGTRLIYPMEKGSMRLINNFGNRTFQFIISLIINLPLTDSLCGTKVFKRGLIEKIKYWQNTIKTEDPFCDFDLLFSASYFGEKILEVPIHYRARTYGKTQIRRFKDGFKLIKYLIKSFYKFNTSL